MNTSDDGSTPRLHEPTMQELAIDVLGLVDQIVESRLAGGELARRRARLKAVAAAEALVCTVPDDLLREAAPPPQSPLIVTELPRWMNTIPAAESPRTHATSSGSTAPDSSGVGKLVERAQAGESEAFGLIYDRYVDTVFRFIRSRVATGNSPRT